MNAYAEWIGRTESRTDRVTAASARGLAALLDHPGDGSVPGAVGFRLGHWLAFQPAAPQSQLGEDGHPRKGGFLPPVSLPRRMWAGGRLTFHGPTPLETELERRSEILDVRERSGRSGDLVFVTVRHSLTAAGAPVITEEQDLVYRAPALAGEAATTAAAPRPADFQRQLTPDSIMLFRYSALTFNGHRIHYDLPYARDVEGYPGLVVQGPLQATLLLDALFRALPDASVNAFSFRGVRPLIAGQPVRLCVTCVEGIAELWIEGAEGVVTMEATATFHRR